MRWLKADTFTAPLGARIHALGVAKPQALAMVARAKGDSGWFAMAALDASTRLLTTVVDARGLKAGAPAEQALRALVTRAEQAGDVANSGIPAHFWSVAHDPEQKKLRITGAVVVHARGVKGPPKRTDSAASAPALVLDAAVIEALREKPEHPVLRLLSLLRDEGLFTPGLLLMGVTLSTLGVLVEALMLRGLFNVGSYLAPGAQTAMAVFALAAFLLLLWLLELPLALGFARLGRRLEVLLRKAYLEKLPRLADRYFQSRLSSDMAERGHMLQLVRGVPALGGRLVRTSLALLVTTVGLVWLDPRGLPIVLAMLTASMGLPLLVSPLLTERDLRFRTHGGALMRFYLDALFGLTPIRSHGAELAITREHESLLAEWSGSGLRLMRTSVMAEAAMGLLNLSLAALLVTSHLARGNDVAGVVLLVYWALALPALGSDLVASARAFPQLRNIALRVNELLDAPEDQVSYERRARRSRYTEAQGVPLYGVRIELDEVEVRAGGHVLLNGLSLSIDPGSHVAIVGRSGAGKSTLLGLLLGFHRPQAGEVFIDGTALDTQRLARLRTETAWVDPSAQLWNRTLVDNLQYGMPPDRVGSLGPALARAQIYDVLERLPDGLQTPLGESGALVSGGEGQRIRLGRALLREPTRLVLLDEPFRGLSRDKRHQLLEQAREHWKKATLLCVTHDVLETQTFGRVLVVENGTLVEDGAPETLLARPDSRYRALIDAERKVLDRLWYHPGWTKVRVEDGKAHTAPVAE